MVRWMARRRQALASRFTVPLVLVRGSLSLPAQYVAIERVEMHPGERVTASSFGTPVMVAVWGLPTLDVRHNDTFVYDGYTFRVVRVRPHRTIATIADAVAIG